MAVRSSTRALIVTALAIPFFTGTLSGILRYQSSQMRKVFDNDTRVTVAHVCHVIDAHANSSTPLTEVFDEDLPALAVIGDSWVAGEPTHTAPLKTSTCPEQHAVPAYLIGRGLSRALRSPVRTQSLASPSAGADSISKQVSQLLADRRMRKSRSRRTALRFAIICMGSADLVHPLAGSLSLPVLTRSINRLQAEGGYRVIVLTCPNLGLLPGVRNPLRTTLRRSSRVLAGSQWVTAVSSGALPVSLNETLRPTAQVGLISHTARYPSALGYRQLASVVVSRILDDIGAQVRVIPETVDEGEEH